MADVTIRATLNGEGVKPASVELSRFISFTEQFQRTLDRLAYSLERQRGAQIDLKQISQYTSLSLTNITESSANYFLSPTETKALPVFPDLAERSAVNLVNGINALKNQPDVLPVGWDQGVLHLAKEMGKNLVLDITQLEFEVVTPSQTWEAIYDLPVRDTIQNLIAEPEERIEGIIGQLLFINFKEDRYGRFSCRIFVDVDSDKTTYLICRFEEEVSEDIEKAVRKTVGAVGIATIDPVTDEPKELRIKQLLVYDGMRDLDAFELEYERALRAYRQEFDSRANFERAWGEVISGDTMDLAAMWEEFDAE